MKSKFTKFLLIFLMVLGLGMLATPAEAWYRYRTYDRVYYVHPVSYRAYTTYRHCNVVVGFWRGGIWYPAHRVCWN